MNNTAPQPQRPTKCSTCHSPHIEYDAIDFEANAVTQDASCTDCEHKWREWYLFSHTRDISREY